MVYPPSSGHNGHILTLWTQWTELLLIRSQALCPLSYGGTGAIIHEKKPQVYLPSLSIALTIKMTLVWKGLQHGRYQIV